MGRFFISPSVRMFVCLSVLQSIRSIRVEGSDCQRGQRGLKTNQRGLRASQRTEGKLEGSDDQPWGSNDQSEGSEGQLEGRRPIGGV